MADVFLSYAHHDSAAADRIADHLQAAGIKVWMERASLKGGDSWMVDIYSALDSASSGLLLLSRASLNSTYVAREYRHFLSAGKPLFVALVDTVLPEEIPHNLEAIHYIDLTDNYEANIDRLVQLIESQGNLQGVKRLRQVAVADESPDSVTLQSSFSKQDVDKLVEEIQESLKSGARNIKVVKSDDE